MSTLKKTLAIFLTVLMLVSSVPAAGLIAFANEADEIVVVMPEEYQGEVPEGWHLTGRTSFDEDGNTIWQIESEASEFGLVNELWIDSDGNRVDNPNYPLAYTDEEVEQNDFGADLPSSYDSRKKIVNGVSIVTPVEYQIGGTCWAHAAIACMETAYINQGLGTSIDLSEYHLSWYAKNGYYAGVTDSANDGYTVADVVGEVLDAGGNMNDVETAMINFSGAVSESRYPLEIKTENGYISKEDLAKDMAEIFTYDKKYQNDVVLESIKAVPYDISAIKQAVLDYGAVKVSYYSADEYYNYKDSLKGWYVGEHQEHFDVAFYHPTATSTNHAVTLVGWDDSFSKENFGTYKPENDGAWLIKNSYSADWGNDGYFWISYEDTSIQLYDSYVVTVSEARDYDDVYLHDGLGSRRYLSNSAKTNIPFANVFTAREDIYLTKVSYGSIFECPYTLKIYTGLPEVCTDPTAGKLIYSQAGNTNEEKYIDIEGNVEISKGTKYSVVLEMNNIYFEYNTINNGKTYGFTAKEGESFFKNGSVWLDTSKPIDSLGTMNNASIRVVAKYPDESGSYKVTFKDDAYYRETVLSENGVVALPQKQGYTYVFTYEGSEFTGENVTRDMVVKAHCYLTDGEFSSDNSCAVEYKCIYCGEKVKEDGYYHIYGEYVVTPPTCAERGYTTYTCGCGDVKIDDYVDALDHDFKWVIDTAATCGATGLKHEKCSRCEVTRSNNTVIEATGNHTYSTVVTPPTCTDDGYTTYTCDCGDVKIDDYVDALDHDFEWVIDTEATCGATGLKHEKCSRCEATRSNNTVIEATGNHTYSTVVTPPTCEDDGYTTYTCGCGYAYTADEKAATGHNMQKTADKIEPKCEVAGKEAVYTCANGCGKTEGGEEITALTHNMQETSAKVEPKCEVAGKEAVYTCANGCGKTEGGATIAALEHKMELTAEKVEPKCEVAGKEAVYTCANNCGKTTGGEVIAAIEHNMQKTADKIEPKCEEAGKEAVYTCANGCGTTTGGEAIAALKHNMQKTADKIEPKCEVAGKEAVYTCANGCGKTEGGDVISALEHNMELTAEKVEPKCEVAGKEAVYTCANNCGKTTGGKEIAALEHDMQKTADKVEPKCEVAGKEAVYTCANNCGKTTGGEVIAAIEHNMQKTADKIEPKCEEAGNEAVYTCANNCGKTTGGESIDATGHKYDSVVTAPTCTLGGYTIYTCACGDTYTADKTSSKGHTYVATVTKPTCTTAGYTTYACGCGEVYTADETPATGHTYEATVVAPTCEAEGYTKYACACGDTYTADKTSATGHDMKQTAVKVEPTCTAAGKEAVYTCANDCGKTEGGEKIKALGHSFGSWYVAKESTCTVKGQQKRDCSVCGDYETKDIATVAHDYNKVVTSATCTAKGYTTYTCNVCSNGYTGDFVPAKGHSDSDADGLCDACGEEMEDPSANCSCMCHKGGFMGFIYKIAQFFWKLFGTNKECACGAVHY